MNRFVRMIKKLKLNNFSIRTKLILIYLLCVIVPIIVFSWAFYNSVTKSAEKEKLILFNQAVDRIGNEIESNAVSAIVTSNIIYADLDMYKLLNRAYQDTQEYLDIYYTKMKDMWSKILPYNTNITILSLYTNNETVLRSNYIYKLEEKASGNNWYDEFNKRNVDAAFINHIDEVSVGYVGSKLVSYVRRLDNVKAGIIPYTQDYVQRGCI